MRTSRSLPEVPEGPFGSGLPPRWALGLAAAAASLLYLNTLENGLVWDDSRLVVHNPDIRSLARIGDLFLHDVGGLPRGHPDHTGSYRPLTTLTYAFNYAAGRLDPAGYHLVNLLLHAACTGFVFKVCILLLGSWRTALAAALLFAAHPVHTEAVANVAGRSELLASLFFLAGLCVYSRCRERPGAGPLAALMALYLGAILSKESAITFPAALFLLDFFPPAPWPSEENGVSIRTRHPWRVYVLLGLSAAVYLVWRSHAAGSLTRVPFTRVENPMAFAAPEAAWLTRFYLLSEYGRLLLWPITLSADYSFDQIPLVESAADPRNLRTVLALAAYGALLIWSLRRARPAAFGLLFLAVTFSVASNLVVPIGTVIGERLLYLPSLGFCLAAASLAAAAADRRPRGRSRACARAAFALVLLAAAARTLARNADWRSNLSLMRSAHAASPRSVKVLYNLGILHSERGEWEEAESCFRRALAVWPEHRHSLRGLARVQMERGRFEDAAALYRRALQLDPHDADTHFGLGVALQRSQRWAEAASAFERVLELEPGHAAAGNNLGFCREQRGDWVGAAECYREGIRRQPGQFQSYYNLARLGLQQGRLGEAESALEQAARAGVRHPDLLRTRYNLAVEHIRAGDTARVAEHFRYILESDPKFPQADQMRADLEAWRRRLKGP
ncbi:MAG: tetratricopeptide repeat protein [Planctomycetes bacterium]|nr:tetratricopeptide repeat protein [Planctomycetota bacterium]